MSNVTDLSELTEAQLKSRIRAAEKELLRREIAALEAQACDCDRYTCGRCQRLMELR